MQMLRSFLFIISGRLSKFRRAQDEAYNNARLLGDALSKQSRFQEAIEAYDQALEVKPNDEATLLSLGDAWNALGELGKP